MKVTLTETSCPNQIFIDRITEHMIYMTRHPDMGALAVLHTRGYNTRQYKWWCVSQGFTYGNGYFEKETLKEAVEHGIRVFNTVHAFRTWQEAFTWALQ